MFAVFGLLSTLSHLLSCIPGRDSVRPPGEGWFRGIEDSLVSPPSTPPLRWG